jgi:hypothetical protein
MSIFDIREDMVANRLARAQNTSNRSRSNHRMDDWLDVALQDSFPCSDPPSSMRAD